MKPFFKDIDRKKITASFEFFPPKNEKMEQKLWSAADQLSLLDPEFISVTYGAGGSTRERTRNIVTRMQQDKGFASAAHLTCVDATRAEVDEIARMYWDAGIRHIVALRGDPSEGIGAAYTPYPGGYAYAADLVAGLKNVADFEISVAGYPEKHPECASFAEDIDNLKRKVDNGADRVITQFFMEPECFLKWRDKVVAAGVNVPIVPGVFPINHFGRAVKFAQMCGSSIPDWMHNIFGDLDETPALRDQIAIVVALEQCRILQENGVEHFHFYTLNRAELIMAICHMLGIRKRDAAPATAV
ncbi:MAG: methylenetetrahydrofolate reductase [NAD(P)H] [Pseudomonadota bacterium]